jgi:hypothetical protein
MRTVHSAFTSEFVIGIHKIEVTIRTVGQYLEDRNDPYQ